MKLLLACALATLAAAATFAGGERFACNMKALSAAERARHSELTKALLAAAQDTTELQNGYAFRFPAATLVTAAEWVALEHRCCPFFTFQLDQARDEGPVTMRITGSEGVKAFIREELGLQAGE